jgi:hypothetical protein
MIGEGNRSRHPDNLSGWRFAFRNFSDIVGHGILMVPPIPEGNCVHCQAPIVDLFAEWTEAYQTAEGKRVILAGDVVFDCYYCQGPLQLVLPLAVVLPQKQPGQYKVAKREQVRCEEWLRNQHPGQTLSQVVESAGWKFGDQWAFHGYNWKEGSVHHHGADHPPSPSGATS